MIRIIDEPVFEMTQAEYARLYAEYALHFSSLMFQRTFEQWLWHNKGFPQALQGRIKP